MRDKKDVLRKKRGALNPETELLHKKSARLDGTGRSHIMMVMMVIRSICSHGRIVADLPACAATRGKTDFWQNQDANARQKALG